MKAIKDSAIYLIGELVSKSVPFLLLPYLSRKLGVEGFGELSYLQTFIALFVIFIGLSQDGAVARYFYAYGKRSLGLIVNAGYTYTLSLTIIVLIVAWILQAEILCYLVLIAASQSFLSVQLSIRQCQKKAIAYTIIQFCSAIFSALLTIVMLEIYSEELVEKRILAMLLSNFLVSIIAYMLYQNNQKSKKFNIEYYKKASLYITAFGVPMIFHHGSFFIKGQLDRVFIYHKFNEVELGIYAMGTQLAGILAVIIIALNKALVPYIFEKLKSKQITLQNLQKWAFYSLFFVPIPTLIVIATPNVIFSFMLGHAFIESQYYFSVFLLSYMLTIPYLFLVNYLFFYGQTKLISHCSMLSVAVYIISLIGLTSSVDIQYIPLASILSAIAMLVFLYIQTSRLNRKLLIGR